MSGYHGTVGTTGVRSAVCSELLRRALWFAALVAGIVFTVWLWSAPAHAEELTPTEAALSDTTSAVGGAGGLGDPIRETLTTVGERATRATDGTRKTVRVVESETTTSAQRVDDAVRGASLSYREPSHPYELAESLVPVAEQVGDPVLDHELTPVRTDVTGEAEEAEEDIEKIKVDDPTAIVAPDHLLDRAVPTAVRAPETATETATEDGDDQRALDRTSVGGNAPTAAPSTAPTAGGTSAVPTVAGFLTTLTAPAPAPGPSAAAWHVMGSVPADSASEPTFSPD